MLSQHRYSQASFLSDDDERTHEKAQSTVSAGTSLIRSTASLRQILSAIDAGLWREARPELAALVNWGGAASEPVHRWFRYREGFSPALISALQLGDRLLDPFCGSGSIMVGAAQLGRRAVGVDVNPLATFIATVKLRPLTDAQLASASDFLATFRRTVTSAEPWPVPRLSIAGKVFEPDILAALLQLRSAIETWPADREVRDFLFLAWLAILQDVGSYFKEGNGIKYRNRLRRTNGYAVRPDGVWQRERFGLDQPGFVWTTYATQLQAMLADTASWRSGTWTSQRVIRASALDLDALLPGETFDSIVFSPPYANRFDYFESQKVELWFGEFVSSYADLGHLRKASLRSHLGADLSRPARIVPALEALIDRMDRTASSWRMRVPSALRGYFDDMFQTLRACRRLVPNGRCNIVVGNSAYAGVIVPTDALIAQLGLEAGFTRARVQVVRHLTVAPQQRAALEGLESFMRESIVVLD